MTQLQKDVFEKLLSGANIAPLSHSSTGILFRLRDANHNPIQKLHWRTVDQLKKLLRKTKGGLYILDRNKVRQLSGHNWAKKFYKESLKQKS